MNPKRPRKRNRLHPNGERLLKVAAIAPAAVKKRKKRKNLKKNQLLKRQQKKLLKNQKYYPKVRVNTVRKNGIKRQ